MQSCKTKNYKIKHYVITINVHIMEQPSLAAEIPTETKMDRQNNKNNKNKNAVATGLKGGNGVTKSDLRDSKVFNDMLHKGVWKY